MRARPVLLAVPLLVLVAGCGGGSDTSGTQAVPAATCEEVDAPAARDPGSKEPPAAPLAPGKTYTLTFVTSCGSFTVTLDQQSAPKTTASLLALARAGYFDDTIFHRVVPGFVIQGGDPSQTGGGGPGYSTIDPPSPDARYTKGVVAMAKTPATPPGTAGSQFFVVTGADASLPPDYAIVGKVTGGMATVARIDALGVQDGPPSRPVVVSKVTVAES